MLKKSKLLVIGYIMIMFCLLNCKSKTSKDEKTTSQNTNALIKESSPYLLQHAHNPVDWYPWTPEIFDRAKKENKLVIISIGYSACHWCHVMEEESFQDEDIADFMNENFISIKVDREERPDIDQIYLEAVQLMTGSGGWPLNCITLPNGKPIFGGTYFTKLQWLEVLKKINELYKNDPKKLIAHSEKVTQGMRDLTLITSDNSHEEITHEIFTTTLAKWQKSFDLTHGGFKGDQKFPMPRSLSTLMRIGYQSKDESILNFVDNSLTKMAYGGIYDQLGGGFSRYTTDSEWQIPHFEKMLYDNAQLVSLYAQAYSRTNNPLYQNIVTETIDFIKLSMTDDIGAFYSAVDADSKSDDNIKKEGVYYVWKKEELKTLINKDDYGYFEKYYNLNNKATLEDKQLILTRASSDASFAKEHMIPLDSLKILVSKWKAILKVERNKRHAPAIDNKSLTSWNALMITGYLDAYNAFGTQSYLDTALKNAHFIIGKQWQPSKGLMHNYRNKKSSILGYLEDYAFTIEAFLKLYEITLDDQWLEHSKILTDFCLSHFLDKKTGLFYFTDSSETQLIIRKMELIDNVIPSSNAVMATNLFKLGHYFSNNAYSNQSIAMLKMMHTHISEAPNGYYQWIDLQTNFVYPYYEVVTVGPQADIKIKELQKQYIPNVLIEGSKVESNRPLLVHRYVENETYIYVCVKGTCKLPVSSVEAAINSISN